MSGGLTFLHSKRVQFLPQMPSSAREVTLRVRSTTLSRDSTVWDVYNEPGLMTSAGVPDLDATRVGASLVLRLFPMEGGAQKRDEELRNLAILQQALRALNGAVVTPQRVVPGVMYVWKEDIPVVLTPALLMETVDGGSVRSLQRGGPCARGALEYAEAVLRELRTALHAQGIALGKIGPRNVLIQYARAAGDDGRGQGMFCERVVLTNWTALKDQSNNSAKSRQEFYARVGALASILGALARR